MAFSYTRSFFVCSSLVELLAQRYVVRSYGSISSKSAFSNKKNSSGKSKRESYPYLLDDAVARDIAKYVWEHTSNDACVFEANPGPGILSRALMKSGIPRLRVFEKDENYLAALEELTSSYPNSFEVIREDIMLLPKLETKDTYDGPEEADSVFFKGIQKHPWHEDPPMSFVAVVADQKSVNFMRSMLAKISLMSSFFTFGRCQFFLVLSGKEYTYITAKPKKNLDKYRSSTVLYNIFFDINFIKEVPGSCLSSVHLPLKQRVKWEASNLHFVHLVPKADMFESVAPANALPELYYFVRHHMTKRTDYVIPAMEKWIPRCGLRLIYDGMKTFVRFGDLSPSDMLRVFQLFSSWPEYEGCMFKHIAHGFFHENLYDVDSLKQDNTLPL